MSGALRFDLRVRVLAAVTGGLSHRQAGKRFGLGAASVGRWSKLECEQGDPKPKALRGDRRSGRIECPSSVNLGYFRRFLNRGSSASGLGVKRLAGDAASVCP
jgi:hypothetical protein